MARTPKNTIKVRRLNAGDRVKISGLVDWTFIGEDGRQRVVVTKTGLAAPLTIPDDRKLKVGDEIELYGKVTKVLPGPLEPLVAARLDGYPYPVNMSEGGFKKA